MMMMMTMTFLSPCLIFVFQSSSRERLHRPTTSNSGRRWCSQQTPFRFLTLSRTSYEFLLSMLMSMLIVILILILTLILTSMHLPFRTLLAVHVHTRLLIVSGVVSVGLRFTLMNMMTVVVLITLSSNCKMFYSVSVFSGGSTTLQSTSFETTTTTTPTTMNETL